MSVLPSLNSIKIGLNLLVNNEPYQVLTANFVRMQQRKPVMQTKLRNLINSKVLEITFKPGDRVEEADLEKRKADYLYSDGSGIHFMDTQSYEQVSIEPAILGERAKLLKEGTQVDVLYFNDNPITVSLPPKIELVVTSAPPGIKGDSSGGVTQIITLETGLTISAPLFVKESDTVRINTESLEYVERV